MNEFITTLAKRSSIACVTRQQFGCVDIEFDEEYRAEKMQLAVDNLRQGYYIMPPQSSDDVKEIRRRQNFLGLIQEFRKFPVPEIRQIVLLPMPLLSEEGTAMEKRWRLSWIYESGPKASDFFQRLLWLLE